MENLLDPLRPIVARSARGHRCGAGKEQLRRLCLWELGRSPMQRLTSLRMERAQELLALTQDTMEKIAQRVGFNDAAVFSRAFKQWVGFSPSLYRESATVRATAATEVSPNSRRRRASETFTSPIRTGTSTSGPITVANAADGARIDS